jgi:hypothetical protein
MADPLSGVKPNKLDHEPTFGSKFGLLRESGRTRGSLEWRGVATEQTFLGDTRRDRGAAAQANYRVSGFCQAFVTASRASDSIRSP